MTTNAFDHHDVGSLGGKAFNLTAEISRVIDTEEAVCQREIMLRPFWRSPDLGRPGPLLSRLAGLWRVRAEELFRLGWSGFGVKRVKEKRLEFALNCLPPSVLFRGRYRMVRRCGLTICPFCWARERSQVFSMLQQRCFPDNAMLAGWRLASSAIQPRAIKASSLAGKEAVSSVARVAEPLKARDGVGELFVLARAFPRQGAAMVEARGFGFAAEPNSAITVEQVRRAISFTFAYPASWLLKPANEVAVILKSIRRRRLFLHWPLEKRESGRSVEGG